MQRLEVSGAVRPIYGSLGVKRLIALNSDLVSSRLVSSSLVSSRLVSLLCEGHKIEYKFHCVAHSRGSI